ncbi:MAG: flagellar motor protein MotB [Acidobacteriota bacterium]
MNSPKIEPSRAARRRARRLEAPVRKRKKEGHPSHERWLVSYADFITLLFAFFVVMFASSHVDQRKVERFSESFRAAIEHLGLFELGSHAMAVSDKAASPEETYRFVEPIGVMAGEDVLRATGERILERLRRENVLHKVRIGNDRRGLVISLAEAAFFDSGSAELRPDSLVILDTIAEEIRKIRNHVRVEGHTDDVPIHNARFPSNWELSTARATQVIAYLLSRYDFDPALLSAAGYGQFHPVADNSTAEGRALNRRVDIVVLNQAAARDEP